MKINKTSCELWPNPCPQVWLRLKMSHLLWHDAENEHLDWVSSMQKAALCTLQFCRMKHRFFIFFLTSGLLELLFIFLYLFPSPTAPQTKLGEVKQRTCYPNMCQPASLERSEHAACLLGSSAQMQAFTTDGWNWIFSSLGVLFLPCLNQKYVCLNIFSEILLLEICLIAFQN